jgi:CheY-like chemotaxis protein
MIEERKMENILVVDDEAPIRHMLKRTLSGIGYTCTLAADALEARKCLDSQPFEIALCDVNMP